jgi:arsenite-transporting ATPase
MFSVPFSKDLDEMLDWKERLIPKMMIFSGKGGVGKTTCCTAAAYYRARAGRHVLVVSIDPAHSLGDSLAIDLSDNEMHEVFPGFSALEMRIAIGKHDNADASRGFDLQALAGDVLFPMSEEASIVIGLAEVFKTIWERKLAFDEIFIDAAPSGHLLRALSFPFQINEYLGRLIGASQKLQALFQINKDRKETIRQKVTAMESYLTIMKVLRNEAISSMVLVTIPETMALAEVERTNAILGDLGIPIKNLIINKIHDTTEEKSSCRFCAARHSQEADIIAEMQDKFGHLNITKVPLMKTEITGLPALASLQLYLFGAKE